MKNLLLATALTAAIFTGCGDDGIAKLGSSSLVEDTISSAASNQTILRVKNASGAIIPSNSVFVSLTSSKTWGTTATYTNSIASNAASTDITIGTITGCTKNVDLMVIMADGNKTIKYDKNLGCGKTYDWTINAF